MFLKTHFTNFINLDVSRVIDFPEFPTPPTSEHKRTEKVSAHR
jgi:hypothetical protein